MCCVRVCCSADYYASFILNSLYRGVLSTSGFYFPIFYLQFHAITHGLNTTFAFYTVSLLVSTNCSWNWLLLSGDDSEWCFRDWPDPPYFRSCTFWCYQHAIRLDVFVCYPRIRMAGCEKRRRWSSLFRGLRIFRWMSWVSTEWVHHSSIWALFLVVTLLAPVYASLSKDVSEIGYVQSGDIEPCTLNDP